MIRNFGKFTQQNLTIDRESGFKFYPMLNEKGEDFHVDIVKEESTYEGSVFLEAVMNFYASVDANGVIGVVSNEPSRVSPEDGQFFIGSEDEITEGDIYDFEANEAYTPEPEPVVVTTITMRQAKLTLSRNGLLAEADEAIAAMEGQQGEEARIEWQYASTLNRDHPLVAALADTLDLSDDYVDDLFTEAASV